MPCTTSIQSYRIRDYVLPELRWGNLVLENTAISVLTEKPFPRDKIIVGIMGMSGKQKDFSGNEFQPSQEQKELGERIGQIVSSRGCIISNGALWGLPYFPIRSAHIEGSYTLGISPYNSKELHQEINPIKHFDMILYAGISSQSEQKFGFLFRDIINTLYPDYVISLGGKWGTLDECSHVLEQGRIYTPIKGTGGATDLLVDAIESKKIVKNNGTIVIIPQDTPTGLEDAINQAIDEAENRWEAEGRTQNRFSHVIDELERVMLLSQ